MNLNQLIAMYENRAVMSQKDAETYVAAKQAQALEQLVTDVRLLAIAIKESRHETL